MPRPEELPKLPLTSDAAILQRVADIVSGALRRQAWFLLLDARRCQLSIIIPVDLPQRPDDDPVQAFGRMLRTLGTIEDVAEVIVVYERPGPEVPTADDLAWLTGMQGAIESVDFPVHGPFLASDQGVTWWGRHHDAGRDDAMMQNWPDEDDHNADAGSGGTRRARHA
jgi:hypothetical protein